MNTLQTIGRLAMPVLFLWGEDDPNGGARIARDFAPRVPEAELVIVPGAEHAPWIDDLATCAARTQSFLLDGPISPGRAGAAPVSRRP